MSTCAGISYLCEIWTGSKGNSGSCATSEPVSKGRRASPGELVGGTSAGRCFPWAFVDSVDFAATLKLA